MPVIDFSAQSELYVLGLLAGVGSFLLSWMLTPLSIKFAWKYGFLDYPSERKLGELLFWHAAPPLGYGVLITVVLFFFEGVVTFHICFVAGTSLKCYKPYRRVKWSFFWD